MKKRGYSYTEMGMVVGLCVGIILGAIMVTRTGEPVYGSVVGIGLALGLGLGAAFEGAKRSEKTRCQRSDGKEQFDGPKQGE